MNRRTRPFPHDGARRGLVLLLMPLAAALATGCFRFDKKPVEKQQYVIQAERPADMPAVANPRGKILAAGLFEVAAPYDRKELVYRLGEHRYASDFYHQFFVPPDAMLTEAALCWISDAGLFEHVAYSRGPLDPTHVLEATVLELYGDFRHPGDPAGVLAIRFLIIDSLTAPPAVLFEREYRSRVALPERGTGALIEGLSSALADILGRFERDLSEASW